MISAPSHVVVVGGGVVGCAVAFWLARAGARVTLVERDELGAHASGKNAGNLDPLFKTPPQLASLAEESLRLHTLLGKELADLGCPTYRLQPVRRILLAFNDSERAALADVSAKRQPPGFTARLLEKREVRTLESRLPEDVCAGLLMEGSMSVEGLLLTRALAAGASKLGATLVRGCIRRLRTATDRVVEVETHENRISCDAIILATGPWVAQIEEWLGISLPVTPLKGQLLRIKLPSLKCDLSYGTTALYRAANDEVWIGGTEEHGGFDPRATEEGRQVLFNGAARILPNISEAELLQHIAALRPMSSTGLPIVGRIKGWSNVYVANGAGRKGLLLCTGIAQAVRDVLITGDNPLPLEFQPV